MKSYIYQLITDQKNDLVAKIIKIFLFFLSLIYWILVKIILWKCRLNILKKKKFSRPVISVGNITFGGVGKTPLVKLIASLLKERSFQPVILTRGYMTDKSESDEAVMLRNSLRDITVLTGKNRYKTAKKFLKKNDADVFVLDDGFQQWSIFKDLEIVVIDATNPFGNHCLIPRGILREPLSSLVRADVFVLTKINQVEGGLDSIYQLLNKVCPDKPIVETIHDSVKLFNINNHGDQKNLAFLNDKTVCLFSGIGDPESFEKNILSLNSKIKKHFVFMDHHTYQESDIERIVHYCFINKISTLITTQKDAIKIQNYAHLFSRNLTVLILEIKIKIVKGEHELKDRILYSCAR